jgi:site-specific DNA recombinase
MGTAVAIYARISQDRTGEGLGVERQLKDCRAEAERRGWLVAQEYVDDDISAWNPRRHVPRTGRCSTTSAAANAMP